MQVLHIQKAKGIGGSERHLLTLLPALAARGVEVRMCVLAAGAGDRFVGELEKRGVAVSVLPAGGHANPLLVPRLVGLIRRLRPDVVHTHLVHGDSYGLLAALPLRVPTVSSVHGAPAFYQRQPYRTVGRVNGRLARRRIAISRYVAHFLEENGLAPAERIRVVYYGLDVDGWAFDETGRQQAREKFGAADDSVVVSIASRLIPGKGHDLLIPAVAEAAAAGHDVRLVIAGDGPTRPALEDLARTTDAVRFLGFVDDVRPLMNASDIVAFPTLPELSEGFGLAALEAMAARRPVVATDVGSLPEVVDDGVTGIVVKPGSVGDLASAIASLAADGDQRARMGAAGRARAETAFTVGAMVDGTIDVYEEVARSGR